MSNFQYLKTLKSSIDFIDRVGERFFMTSLFGFLLIAHITAGTATLLSSVIAIVSKLVDQPHKWHVISGRIFFYGMAGIFVTALSICQCL